MAEKIKTRKIVVAGSAANPPTIAHRELGEALTHSLLFDLVLWVPSGARPDKPELIPALHRLRMTELTFPKEWQEAQPTKFCIDARDINRENTPTISLLEDISREYPECEIVFATGADVLTPKEKFHGECDVEAYWVRGKELYQNQSFAVFSRAGYPINSGERLPPHHVIMSAEIAPLSSTEVRRRIAAGEEVGGMVAPLVEKYIAEQSLYWDKTC